MMDSKEILAMMEALSVQRRIPKESVATALEVSIAAAVSSQMNIPNSGEDGIVRVNINRTTGSFNIIKMLPKSPEFTEIALESNDFPKDKFDSEEIPTVVFDRVAIQVAKQLILQKVREAERQQLVDDFLPQLNKLIVGTVKRITRAKDIIVLIHDRVEAVLPFDNLLPQDNYEIDDEIVAVLKEVDPSKSVNQLFLSRAADEMVRELFVREVPEISQQIVEICAIARLPGVRSKVAIRPKDHRVDAMSACIGIRGRRVQAVQKELGGEKVDILQWNDNPEQLVKNVLANASISSVNLNPETHTIDVAVPSDVIGEILGRNGQNIRLATLLIGWDINIMEEGEADEKRTQALHDLTASFTEILDADDDLVNDLVNGGFSSIKQLAYAPTEKFLRIEGFDEDLANEIRERARENLLSNALNKDDVPDRKLLEELMKLEGMTDEFAQQLSMRGVSTLPELAEYSVDELEEIIPDVDKELAATIILEARKQ